MKFLLIVAVWPVFTTGPAHCRAAIGMKPFSSPAGSAPCGEVTRSCSKHLSHQEWAWQPRACGRHSWEKNSRPRDGPSISQASHGTVCCCFAGRLTGSVGQWWEVWGFSGTTEGASWGFHNYDCMVARLLPPSTQFPPPFFWFVLILQNHNFNPSCNHRLNAPLTIMFH